MNKRFIGNVRTFANSLHTRFNKANLMPDKNYRQSNELKLYSKLVHFFIKCNKETLLTWEQKRLAVPSLSLSNNVLLLLLESSKY